MSREKQSFKDIETSINEEGLSYYLMYYTNGNEIPTKKGRKLFKKAKKALEEFSDYIDKKVKEEEGTENF